MDRVGGGDCFAAGLIYGLHDAWHGHQERWSSRWRRLPEALDSGDFNRFTVDEVKALLKGGGSGRVQR